MQMRIYFSKHYLNNSTFLLHNSIEKELDLRGLLSYNFTIERDECGKPFVKNIKNLSFNLSHTSCMWVCVFSDTGEPIGIDIEKKDRLPSEHSIIAKEYFHYKEISLYNQAVNNFIRIWSAKESYVKCYGMGTKKEISSFTVVENNKIKRNVLDCNLEQFEFEDKFILSICSVEDINSIELIEIPNFFEDSLYA